jgi:sphinganine-1-phosphate aldolase
MPITAHAAFEKAGEAFRIKIIKIPYDPKTYQVNLKKVQAAITSNTVCIVGSFPNFPHKVADDIEGLSKIALKYKVPLHVDACLGGFLVAFYSSAKIEIPKFNFSLPGVTSISADFHKYGLCPKGISLLLYANRNYRKYQFFIYPHFMGGTYPSVNLQGSRTPAMIVAAYAIIHHLGKNAYVNQARKIYEEIKKIKIYVKENLQDLRIIGDPFICGFSITGDRIMNIYDQMSSKGWQLNLVSNPIGLGFVITTANLDSIEKGEFVADLQEAYDYVKENKKLKLSEHCQMYGMSLNIPEPIIKQNLDVIMDSMLDC